MQHISTIMMIHRRACTFKGRMSSRWRTTPSGAGGERATDWRPRKPHGTMGLDWYNRELHRNRTDPVPGFKGTFWLIDTSTVGTKTFDSRQAEKRGNKP